MNRLSWGAASRAGKGPKEPAKHPTYPSPSPQAPYTGVMSEQRHGVHSLVGGMAVTDHLGQDPLLIPIHSLYPSGHLVSRFGHVVPRGWDGPTEGWGPGGGIRCQPQPLPLVSSPTPGLPSLVTRLPDPQGQGHGRLLQQGHQHPPAHGLPRGLRVIVEARNLGRCGKEASP